MMANQVQKWLSKKKNRKMLFFLLGVIVLFFYVRNRSAAAPGYNSGTGTPGTSNGNATTRVIPYPPGNGVMSPKLADYGSLEHLNIKWTGSDGNWTAQDLAIVEKPAGYTERYYIGGQVIYGQLTNFKWESNNMITIHKIIVKNGVEDLYFWARNADDPLRRPDDGYTMSGNTSVAHQTFYFNKY
jgi:hypothetical protein